MNESCFVLPWLMETISLLWQFEDLACDWTENSKHSRHILGVHGFGSLIVKSVTVDVACHTMLCIIKQH